MRPDGILDRELSPSAPPSLSLVLDLLRRHVKIHRQGEAGGPGGDLGGTPSGTPGGARRVPPTEDNLHTTVERAVAVIGAKDGAAQRKIRQLAQEGQALRRTIASLELQANRLDDRLTELQLDIDCGEKEASALTVQLQAAAVEFCELAEAAAQPRPDLAGLSTDERVHRDERVDRDERVERDEGGGSKERENGLCTLQLCQRREENFLRYAFASAAASSHASIQAL